MSPPLPLEQIHVLAPGAVVFCRYRYRQYYLAGEPEVELGVALVGDEGGSTVLLVCDRPDALERGVTGGELDEQRLQSLADALQIPILRLDQPWRLEPVSIPKPWGREIWYTGIESRGQSRVTDGRHSLPLPWALAAGQSALLGTDDRAPNLLKILDPLPEPVFGDLYFELHEEKREVYVVTHVDRSAWPDGHGAIRFGFDPAVRTRYGSDTAFRQGFADAVADYEVVRRQIDALVDDMREREGVGLNEPVAADRLKGWLEQVPADLKQRETALRERMNAFTAMVSLRVGDVVKVPCLTPHALQHGVRTVEFQTPVYERRILSFAQKVLTQSHWDTREAVAMMDLGQGEVEQLPLISEDNGHRLEQVVRFDDFEVQRLTLRPGQHWQAQHSATYRLCMMVAGGALVDGVDLAPEQALFVPAMAGGLAVLAGGDRPATVLIAMPVAALT